MGGVARVLLWLAAIVVFVGCGWLLYSNSQLGRCHAIAREIATFQVGVRLKQMMHLPVTERDALHRQIVCSRYSGDCQDHLDDDILNICSRK